MTQDQIKDTLRRFLRVSESGDIEKALLFIDKDAEVSDSGKTFKGTNEIRKYLSEMMGTMTDRTVTETGMGIIAESNVGVVEYILSGTYLSGVIQGMRVEIPAVVIYEFKNDKIQSIRGFFDKWRLAQKPRAQWIDNTTAKSRNEPDHLARLNTVGNRELAVI